MNDLENRYATREEWLRAALVLVGTDFAALGVELPPAKISCGWPSRGALSEKNPVWGQCWHVEACSDGIAQIFVSPLIDDPVVAMGIIYHEAIHVALGKGAKHGPKFKDLGIKLGLTGRPKAMVPDDTLTDTIKQRIVNSHLGQYPQAAIVPTKETKPDRCRQLKVFCPGDSPQTPDHIAETHRKYIVRTTQKNLDEFGPPLCPVCEIVMRVEEPKL